MACGLPGAVALSPPDISPVLHQNRPQPAGTLAVAQGSPSMSSTILRAAVCALPACLLLPASHLRAEEVMAPVVVTATRFADPDPRIPANISVITRDDIRTTPALNLPDLLATRAGVNVSTMYGPLGIDATVDIGGFGVTATSNTLILVDGQRLNPIDSANLIWAALPLESIERIEIMRGSGTVLYGDRATSGVINIITDKSGKPRASATATVGSYGYRGLDASVATGNEHAYFNLFARYADSDGYRRNNWQNQQAASGRAGLKLERGEVFTDYAVYKEASGLPGALTQPQFQANPRNASTLFDNQWKEGYRLRPGITYALTDTVTVEGEIASEHQDVKSTFVDYGGASNRVRDTLAFTPRLRWSHGLGSLASVTVAGLDHYDGTVSATNRGSANQWAHQTSTAYYLQNVTNLTQQLSLTMGGRSQSMSQSANQAEFGLQSAMAGRSNRTRNAYDIGLAYAQDAWRVYGKTGTTFRFANIDELFGNPFGTTPFFAGNIRPQHGTIQEVGGSLKLGAWSTKLSFSRLDLTDEIGYDPSNYTNTNFKPTRRDSANFELEWKASDRWNNRFTYTYLDATFRSGANAGKTVPLAPRDQATLQSTWKGGAWGTYSLAARYVGNRRLDGDFANQQSWLAGYFTADLQGSWTVQKVTLTAKLLNALDKKYSPYAYFQAYDSTINYYPADGRTAYVSARYDF